MVGLDCENPVTRLASAFAIEEAAGTSFFPDAMQFWELDTVVCSRLLQADLRHQLIDFDKRLLFGGRQGERGKGVGRGCYARPQPMASHTCRTLVTPRDLEILAALDRTPLTAAQLLKLSRTFARPFTTERRVRERLQVLSAADLVLQSQYATCSPGILSYYLLTKVGYRLLHSPDASPPTKRYFSPIGIANQYHTQGLADFIVHTAVCAHRAALRLKNFSRENTLRLEAGDQFLWPDCSFQLLRPDGIEFSFFVELDNSTERIRSQKELDSWQRKIGLYDEYQNTSRARFRVLIVATRSAERLGNILAAAAELVRNPHRSLFYGITLGDYLAQSEGVTSPCFKDHLDRSVALAWRGRPAYYHRTTSPVSVPENRHHLLETSRAAPSLC